MDMLHDTSWRQYMTIAATYKLPEYVLAYEPMTKDAAATMDDALFADVVYKRFPIDTPASTWLSAAYFNENRKDIPSDLATVVEDNIKMAASLYGIDQDVKNVLEYQASSPEIPDSYYGYVDKAGHKHYPMFDSLGVEKAGEHYAKHRFTYAPEIRKQISSAIVKRANETDVAVPHAVFRDAGVGATNMEDLSDNLLYRAQVLMDKDAELATVIANMSKALNAATPAEVSEQLDKVATIIEAADRIYGLDKVYGREYLAPQDFIYSMDIKQASAFVKDAISLNRHVFSLDKLATLDPDIFKTALGADLFSSIVDEKGTLSKTKMAEVLPTLPRPDKIMLEEHIVACCDE